MSSSGSTGPIFPKEGIFCKKDEIKGPNRRTERPITFPSWKNKENAWQQKAVRAEKMGLVRLHRLVKDVDLFAADARHHPSCLIFFRTAYVNYERSVLRVSEATDTLMSVAHEKAFALVLENV